VAPETVLNAQPEGKLTNVVPKGMDGGAEAIIVAAA
jgi:hypothetical protein